jgi:hypothetical protein
VHGVERTVFNERGQGTFGQFPPSIYLNFCRNMDYMTQFFTWKKGKNGDLQKQAVSESRLPAKFNCENLVWVRRISKNLKTGALTVKIELVNCLFDEVGIDKKTTKKKRPCLIPDKGEWVATLDPDQSAQVVVMKRKSEAPGAPKKQQATKKIKRSAKQKPTLPVFQETDSDSDSSSGQ